MNYSNYPDDIDKLEYNEDNHSIFPFLVGHPLEIIIK